MAKHGRRLLGREVIRPGVAAEGEVDRGGAAALRAEGGGATGVQGGIIQRGVGVVAVGATARTSAAGPGADAAAASASASTAAAAVAAIATAAAARPSAAEGGSAKRRAATRTQRLQPTSPGGRWPVRGVGGEAGREPPALAEGGVLVGELCTHTAGATASAARMRHLIERRARSQ